MNINESVNLRCMCEDILFECFLDKGFFSPALMQFEPHLHAQYEIHIVEKGEYILEELHKEKRNVLKEGMIAVIPPNCYHNTFFENEETYERINVSRYVLRIDFSKAKNAICNIALHEKFKDIMVNSCRDVFIFDSVEATDAARCLYNELRKTDSLSQIKVNAYLKLCMTDIIYDLMKSLYKSDTSPVSKRNNESSRKNEIERFVEENYDKSDLRAEMLEKHLNLSKRHTIRIMNEYYGMPFNKFLINFRLARAEKFLLRTNMTIEKISEIVGYESVTGFFIAFKKKYGMSPSDFRKLNN